MQRQVLVVGGGVSGLTCALALLRAGYKDVRVVAREFGSETVSYAAGALWEYPPYHVEPVERCKAWAAATYRHLERIQGSGAELCGVRRRRLLMMLAGEGAEEGPPGPDREHMPGFRMLSAAQVAQEFPEAAPAPSAAGGFAYSTIVASMPHYLTWLAQQALREGVELVEGEVTDLDAVLRPGRVVINCAGLRGAELAGDEPPDACYPVKGQVVLVHAPHLRDAIENDGSFLIPREEGIVLVGGTLEEGEWDTTAHEDVAQRLLEQAARKCAPGIAQAPVVRTYAGLRPCRRGGVRLELQQRDNGLVLHNYGHGGSGVVLSWGIAEEVVSMLSPSSPAPAPAPTSRL